MLQEHWLWVPKQPLVEGATRMATLHALKPVSDCLKSCQRTLVLAMHYAALAAAVVVALAAALMCSGSELATILMAVTVFVLGLLLGKGRISEGRSVKVKSEVRLSMCTSTPT